ncbi:MAG TPA: multidrug efflux SMR transporter [Pirellulales bacterium]|nr:multidrug efflux SMR transporter [Pirellulales bacterium]
MKSYVYLTIAIAAEVVATSALKKTDQFTRLGPSLVVAVGSLTAFYFLTLVLDNIPVGVTYAIWSGLGIVFVTLASSVIYGQRPDLPAALGMALIIAGVVIMNVFSRSVVH